MAAYCVLRGIDYIVEECPMAIGNKHLGYKEALNAIEATSPGSKFDFYFGFLARASEQFRPKVEADQGELERSEEHTSELQSLMRISYAVFCLKKKKHTKRR